ncbi:hypothetical protein [Paracoccus yeei]|uniref:hypothetical protein n=1 Tax=Paracoccus yeei TaxID=147645 RepID=UPI0012FD24C7|nr:hypothetical protein [Paracoccus yeei]
MHPLQKDRPFRRIDAGADEGLDLAVRDRDGAVVALVLDAQRLAEIAGCNLARAIRRKVCETQRIVQVDHRAALRGFVWNLRTDKSTIATKST